MTLPTEPAPLEKMSTLEMVHRIHREINALQRSVTELELRVESAFPGADFNRHRTDHEAIHEAEHDAKQLKKDLWTRSVTGAWVGFWSLVIAGLMLLFNVKIGGGK